ncbi:MAG TPA: cytochrome c oxidase subunit II [Chloroflexota bacterium]|nr:cytochrome c oxidase subunit II [Chloroflexota bacterium]
MRAQCRGAVARRWPLLAFPLVLALAACSPTDPANTFAYNGDVARVVGELYWFTFWWAAAVFVVVNALLLYAIWRFRRRPEHGIPPQVHGNTRLEIMWTIVPTLILVAVGVPTIRTLFELEEPPAPPAVEVEVTGHQWWWEFRYPAYNIVTAGELHIPVGQPVRLTLHSADVVHSFWAPRLAGKKDVFPGPRVNHMWFNATEPGIYYGQCVEFCGMQHAQMRFFVVAEPAEQFQAWVRNQQAPAAAPTDPSAQRGAEAFTRLGCMACHTIEGTSARGQVGPNLTHVGSRLALAGGILENNPENLARWLRNPQEVKVGNKMPNLNLNEQDIRDLVAYLTSLK